MNSYTAYFYTNKGDVTPVRSVIIQAASQEVAAIIAKGLMHAGEARVDVP